MAQQVMTAENDGGQTEEVQGAVTTLAGTPTPSGLGLP